MQKCPNCGTMNRAGVLLCEKCGTNLVTGKSQTATRSLGDDELMPADKSKASESRALTDNKLPPAPVAVPKPAPPRPAVRGTDEFPKGGTLRLEVEGSSKSIQVPLTVHHREIVLGRRDPATGALPDIDLTPFAGYRMGVSRRHSLIRYSEGKFLDLFDQGSSNGTFLNEQRMDAHYPYRLHDSDRIRLGQITIRIHFDPGGTATAKPDQNADRKPKATAPLIGSAKPAATAEKTIDVESMEELARQKQEAEKKSFEAHQKAEAEKADKKPPAEKPSASVVAAEVKPGKETPQKDKPVAAKPDDEKPAKEEKVEKAPSDKKDDKKK